MDKKLYIYGFIIFFMAETSGFTAVALGYQSVWEFLYVFGFQLASLIILIKLDKYMNST